MDIKLILSDVDPNKYMRTKWSSRNGIHPVLQIRTRDNGSRSTVLAAVRAGTNGEAAILLCDGVLITKARSICRLPGSLRLFACAQSRRLPGLHYTAFTSFWQHTSSPSTGITVSAVADPRDPGL